MRKMKTNNIYRKDVMLSNVFLELKKDISNLGTNISEYSTLRIHYENVSSDILEKELNIWKKEGWY